MRSLLLALSKSRWANHLAKRYGLRFGANRFVAGETIETALSKVRVLNESGLLATMDHLGEFVATELEAHDAAQACLRTLDAIAEQRVQANLSLKLTQMGLDLDRALAVGHMREILTRAKERDLFVRLDMEDYRHCEPTLDLLRELRKDFDNVGTVIQAYLYRAEKDVDALVEAGVPLRIVKGAYKESKDVAFPSKADVDENYKRILELCLDGGVYTAIATHDEALIAWTKAFADRRRIGANRFEFQMLYGIRPKLQQDLARQGYQVRIYVPFGTDWYGYYMRRLAERPANVGFVLRSLWRA